VLSGRVTKRRYEDFKTSSLVASPSIDNTLTATLTATPSGSLGKFTAANFVWTKGRTYWNVHKYTMQSLDSPPIGRNDKKQTSHFDLIVLLGCAILKLLFLLDFQGSKADIRRIITPTFLTAALTQTGVKNFWKHLSMRRANLRKDILSTGIENLAMLLKGLDLYPALSVSRDERFDHWNKLCIEPAFGIFCSISMDIIDIPQIFDH